VFRCSWARTGVAVYLASLVIVVRPTSTSVSLHRAPTAARALTASTPSGAHARRVTPEVAALARWTAAYRDRARTLARVTRCRSPPEVTCAHALPDMWATCARRKWMNVFPVRVLMAVRVLTSSPDINAAVSQDSRVRATICHLYRLIDLLI